MRSKGRVVVCVCLCVRSFFACLVLDLFQVSFSLIEIALVNKLAFLRSAFESDQPGARESLFSGHLDDS